MPIYISFLRGINVSGKRIIHMIELQALYELLDFQNVKTYIQSGNVLFLSKEISSEKLCKKIELAIKEKWGFFVPVIIRTPEELKSVITKFPFGKEVEEKTRAVSFLNKMPKESNLELLKNEIFEVDKFHIRGCEIYLHYPLGQANTKLTNNLIEKKLQVNSTIRNWKTIQKMIALSEVFKEVSD
ncbi:MAG TPA: DUF1697 domain-containing protein [Arachidicoccus soli]|nr:DUF1697 domain-containing protein [Arachidicoccus soli]